MEYLNNDFISYEVKDIGYEKTSIHFVLKRQLKPQDLKNIHPPNPVKNKFSKNCSAFGENSNEAGGIVDSHTKEIEVGDLIIIEKE